MRRQTEMQTATNQCGWLTASVGAVWLVLAGPVALWLGPVGLEGLSYAALLCLVPGWLVFWVTCRYRVPSIHAAVVLLGTGFRLAFVLLGLLAVRSVRPQLGFQEFQLWLIVFYLAALAVETLLVARQAPARGGGAGTDSRQ